jgi:predicted RNase H-like HicB family nuclease
VAEHRVVYRRNAAGQWVATVPGRRGCRGQGRTLRQARQRLRAALARVVNDPFEVDFAEDVRLPPPARARLVQHWKARRRLERETERADLASTAALHSLLALKLNVKDVGDLLGLSPQKLVRLKKRAAPPA